VFVALQVFGESVLNDAVAMVREVWLLACVSVPH